MGVETVKNRTHILEYMMLAKEKHLSKGVQKSANDTSRIVTAVGASTGVVTAAVSCLYSKLDSCITMPKPQSCGPYLKHEPHHPRPSRLASVPVRE